MKILLVWMTQDLSVILERIHQNILIEESTVTIHSQSIVALQVHLDYANCWGMISCIHHTQNENCLHTHIN